MTGRTLRAVFAELYAQDIHLRGTLLKPNMVIAGQDAPAESPADQVARLTVHSFLRHVPALVPGIVFLSGGQSEVEATENLNAINQVARSLAAVVLVRPGAPGFRAAGVAR